MLLQVLLIILILVVIGALPGLGGHIHNLGYGPSGIGFIIIIILVIILLR